MLQEQKTKGSADQGRVDALFLSFSVVTEKGKKRGESG